LHPRKVIPQFIVALFLLSDMQCVAATPTLLERIFEQTRKAAEQGNAEAQTKLGAMYTQGQFVKQDYAEAVKWFRLAAEQGNAAAQYFLGGMYERGQGVKQDYAEALNWYRKAADQGDAGGQGSLGRMYENGQAVTRDYAQALKLVSQSR
jgi:uncharacterized protein